MIETDDGIRISGFHLSDCIGRSVICEDGVNRRIEQISASQMYADKVLINEVNEDETPGGAWVHVLSLSSQMHGTGVPTREQTKAFSRTMNAIKFRPESGQTMPGFVKLPSGIILNSN